MKENLFMPIANPIIPAFANRKSILGLEMELNEKDIPKFEHKEIAIIGIDPVLAAETRKTLYNYSSEYFDTSKIIDLGDLLSGTLMEKVESVISLINSGICPILIGADVEWVACMQDVWDSQMNPYRISLISDTDLYLEDLNPFSVYLKEIHLIGFQRQHPKMNNIVLQDVLHVIRVGEFRQKQSVAEPFIRRSDLMYFDLNSIRNSDAPANERKNPCGLFSEEACALSRMGGLGDKLKTLVISPWTEGGINGQIQSSLVAQIIWYFLEGYHLRKLDTQISKDSLTKYSVELKDVDYVICFYKSEHSGKWWFEEPIIDNEFSNQLIPCTYEEYCSTAQNQIPNRILEFIQS